MLGPFSSSVDCESYRVNRGSFEYCLPLRQEEVALALR